MIHIKTNVKVLARTIKRKMPVLQQSTRDEFDTVVNLAENIMKMFAPVRRGVLRDSIDTKKLPYTDTGNFIHLHAEVGPRVPYWVYPEEGTGPSAGRYVPALGRRIDTGQHPGTPAQYYIRRTREYVASVMPLHQARLEQSIARKFNAIGKPGGRT
tara:strand:- start:2128 stop:2595 length:468 start_codon:yes stop_codon:yes gene_type:complete